MHKSIQKKGANTTKKSQPFFSPSFIQPKLSIGAPKDRYEQESDTMADKVMRMSQNTPAIQTRCADCEHEGMMQNMPLMLKSEDGGGLATQALTTQLNTTNGRGSPLPTSTNSYMSQIFGSDFSNVKVHADCSANEMSKGLNAKAFTHGSNIYFNKGEYSPGSSSGKRLLAHELTHVLQQNASRRLSIQRDEFVPWAGQSGHDVSGTRMRLGNIIQEQVQRIGDPTYRQLDPMLLEFNSRTCNLTVKKQINFVNANPGEGEGQLSTEAFNQLKSRIIDIANDRLNGWVHIEFVSSDTCTLACDGNQIAVKVETIEGNASYSSTVNLHRTYGRENAGNIGADASDRTIWHEMGHVVLGAADEYYEENRPDGTPRPQNRVEESDWSIMSQGVGGRRQLMHARHFSHLPAWLSRRYPDCGFELVEDRPAIVPEISPNIFLGGFGTATGLPGLWYSLGLDIGIPIDRLRRLEVILGPRLNYINNIDAGLHSFFLGFRVGLEGQFAPEGFRLGGYVEGGGLGINEGEPGFSPYVEGGITAGYSWQNDVPINVGIEAATGGREFMVPGETTLDPLTPQFLQYYRLGLRAAVDF